MPSLRRPLRLQRFAFGVALRTLGLGAAMWGVLGTQTPAQAQCTVWTNRNAPIPRPAGMPPSYDWHPTNLTLVYDSFRHVTVCIGGSADRPGLAGEALYYLPLCEYDGTQWVSRYGPGVTNTPTYRRIGGAAFDSFRNVTVVYGGATSSYVAMNELLEYNGTTWTHRTPAGASPPASVRAPMAYDPIRHRTIVLVQKPGHTSDTFQTWEWSGSAWDQGPDMGPTDTSAAAMVFDTARNRAFVCSGGATTDTGEVWEYTPGATAAQGVWTRVVLPGVPLPKYRGVSLIYDSHRQRVFRHGGHDNALFGYYQYTFVWDWGVLHWVLVAGMNVENARAYAGSTFDSDRDLAIVCGGVRYYQDHTGTGRTTTFSDTWEYSQGLPGFASLPSSATLDGGQTALFAAAVLGADVSLQWRRNGSPIPGATGPILAVTDVSQAVAGGYVLRATNACGAIDTPAATLTVRPPTNNVVATPSVIYSATIYGTTLGATPDGTAPCGTSSASPDVWYKYTVPYAGQLTMDTCGSNYDTVMSFHSLNLSTVIGCSDDTQVPPSGCAGTASTLSMAVTQGQQFLVRISGYQGAAGNYTLNTKVVPFNNACGVPTPVFGGTYSGSTAGATVDGSASCGTSFNTPDIWYRFRSDCLGTLTLTTSGSSFDTVLSVRAGSCAGAEVACNDDVQVGTAWSSVAATVQPGVDYFIRASGYSGATGNVVLNVYPPSFPEDSCEGAVPIGLGERVYRTRCATTTALALPPWCEDAAGAVPFYDVWYRYTAAAPGMLQARLCNLTFNTALAVYASSCPTSGYGALACGAREDSCGQTPLVQFPTLPGEQYLLRLGGYYGLNGGLAGSGTIELTLVPFDTGACCLSVGGCSLTSMYECPGVFSGEGSTCVPAPCPSFAGSCCIGAQCSVIDASPCAAAGGAFGGSGSVCLQSVQNPVTCCRANVNQVGGLSVADIFAFLTAWFAGDSLADFNADGTKAVGDIFAFLTAWFGGC